MLGMRLKISLSVYMSTRWIDWNVQQVEVNTIASAELPSLSHTVDLYLDMELWLVELASLYLPCYFHADTDCESDFSPQSGFLLNGKAVTDNVYWMTQNGNKSFIKSNFPITPASSGSQVSGSGQELGGMGSQQGWRTLLHGARLPGGDMLAGEGGCTLCWGRLRQKVDGTGGQVGGGPENRACFN